MLLRPKWLRLRGRWVCAGLGLVCVTGFSFSGCSRAPMARFKDLTSAPPQTSDADETSTASRSTARDRSDSEQPDPRDAVAARTAEREPEGQVTIVADSPRRSTFKTYREGYASLRDRVLNRETSDSRDPFLESGASPEANQFPATEALAPDAEGRVRTGNLDDSIARADLQPRRTAAVDTASLSRTGTNEGLVRTSPGGTSSSRLDQLRAELREQRSAAPATAAAVAPVRDTNRGTILSGGSGSEEEGVVSTASPYPARTAVAGQASSTSTTAGAETVAQPGDVALRVQSLLAAAEWMASQGQLEEAYRNAMLAQHLAEYSHLQFGPLDRNPNEVCQAIWDRAQAERGLAAVTLSLPKPKLPAGAERRAVPRNAFPGRDANSWQKSDATEPLPVIAPRGTDPGPALAAPLAAPAPASAGPTPPAVLDHVASTAPANAGNPVTIARIDSEPAPATAPAAAVVPPATPLPAAPATAEATPPSGVINALAQTPESSASQSPRGTTEPTTLSVPAMASLPTVSRTLPLDGPALAGPQLARTEPAEPPPYLEVIGARRVPEGDAAAPGESPRRQGVLWGLGGLVALMLGAAVMFRRRWSAGAAGKK